ncbi:hypothetical protein [Streptosporangium saharense]|uniref:hypothetical protein n=1 Tax=Streptosporangium saharense TaxID=1706840 RepID=UPI003416951F
MTAVDLQTRTLTTPRGVWTITAKLTRPDGGADVILRFIATGNRAGLHFGYRRLPTGEWTHLTGAYSERTKALTGFTGKTAKQQGELRYRDLVPLLEIAAELADFPETGGAR